MRAPTSDEAVVFPALDLTPPALAAVAAAVQTGDYETASHAWAAYLRGRQGFNWGGKDAEVPTTYNVQVAEDAARGKVQGGSVQLVYAFPDGKIDWFFNATHHTAGVSPNMEWQWQLNRMEFWKVMAAAYQVTKDERYPKAFGQQLRSWVEQCPVPDHVENTPDSAWRTIEAGIRMSGMWPQAFFHFLPSPSLTDADIMAYTRSTADHARYLLKFETDVNWVLMEMNGLVTCGCFFPEFREAKGWRSHAFARLDAEAHRQLLPDGGQIELSTGYHDDVVIHNFLAARDVARWTGFGDEVPADYVGALEKLFDWAMYLSTPDRGRPKVNDAWPGKIEVTLKPTAKLFPQREDFRWFLTDGAQGKLPEKTSVFLDWTGLVVMRSGWDKDANYLLFRVGPMGYGGHMGLGHAHQDKLDVMLWAYGRELLFVDGGSSYAQDKWRIWSRSSLAANCVLVDGLGQDNGNLVQNDGKKTDDTNGEHDPGRISQRPIQAGWQSHPDYDFATGVYDGDYGTSEYNPTIQGVYDMERGPQKRRIASQRRSVLFLKPDIYIVSDVMTPIDGAEHTYQARWQLITPKTSLDPETQSLETVDENVPNLVVAPLLVQGLEARAASAQETPEILGWNCRKDMTPQNIPSTTLMHTRKGVGTQRFLTLLLPLKVGQKNPLTLLKAADQSAEVQLADGRHFFISMTDNGGIIAREILPDGREGCTVKGGPASTDD